MKKFFVSAMLLFGVCSINVNAQLVDKNGTVLVQAKSKTKTKKDTICTGMTWGPESLQVILRKDNGWAYVWRKSKKSGRYYPVYLSEEEEKVVAGKFNINYTPHNRKGKK